MIEDNIKRIQDSLRIGFYTNNPAACAEDHSILAGEYSWICSQLEEIMKRKPSVWNKMRGDHKSDTACERAYQATDDGINEQGLRLRAKAIERMMSALKSLIRIAEGEMKNLI